MPIDAALRSWIDIHPEDDFPIQNLPFGVISTSDWGPRVAVAIGGYALDLYACAQLGYFDALADDLPALGAALPKVFRRRSLNALLRLGPAVWQGVRQRCADLLRYDNPALRDNELAMRTCLLRLSEVELLRPLKPTAYTIFGQHAGLGAAPPQLPESTLPSRPQHLPAAHYGRASSIVASGAAVRRPLGQHLPAGQAEPVFGPTQQLDIEAQTAFVVGQGTAPDATVPIDQAEAHLAGLLLLGSWGARDVQHWEGQALGSFLSTSFASSLSPWVVTLDALEPFRVAGPAQEPGPLPYLQANGPHHYDITLEVLLQPAGAAKPVLLGRTNTQHTYWSMAQQVAYLSSTNNPPQVGELCASGVGNGPSPASLGSLLALIQNGQQALTLPDGRPHHWLEDGDTVILRGYAAKAGLRIGLGEVRGTVLPAAK